MTDRKQQLIDAILAHKSEHKLTQAKLALKIGVSRSQIANVLKGRFCSVNSLLTYTNKLGIKFELVQTSS